MKMNILNFMLGMMVAIGLGIIGMFIIQGVNYLNLFLLIMSGAFWGFPIGYCIDQHLNGETNDLGPNRDPAKLN